MESSTLVLHAGRPAAWNNRNPAMADPTQRVPENTRGRFYVDATCIDCDLCREKAPANFTRNDHARYSYVYRQPATATDVAHCLEALRECPVEAIGDTGGA